jgi:hypothetical protein
LAPCSGGHYRLRLHARACAFGRRAGDHGDGLAAAAVVAEAVAAGEAHPRLSVTVPRSPGFVAAEGTADRRCVAVAGAPVRSGEFVLKPPSHPDSLEPPPASRPGHGSVNLVPAW